MNDRTEAVTGADEPDRGVELMLAFQAGREEAFDEIVSLYEAPVFALLRRLLGSRAQVEDLAQEAFVRLHRARERYRPQGKLGTFLYRITYNLALNALRDEKRRRTGSLPTDESGSTIDLEDARSKAPMEGAQQASWADKIEWALGELPENQRAALVFQHYDGLDLREIGDLLGVSAKAVKSLLHRARDNMRKLLEPYREAEE